MNFRIPFFLQVFLVSLSFVASDPAPDSNPYGNPQDGCETDETDQCVDYDADSNCQQDMCSASCQQASDCPVGSYPLGFVGAACLADTQGKGGHCVPMCTTDSDCNFNQDYTAQCFQNCYTNQDGSSHGCCAYPVSTPEPEPTPNSNQNGLTYSGIALGGLLLIVLCCRCCKKKPAAQQSEPLINSHSSSSQYNTSTSSFIDVEQNSGGAPADFSMPGITWKPPSQRKKALTLRSKLQQLQDQLVANGKWTSKERATITEKHLPAAKSFLDQCKAEAAKDLAPLKYVINKLEKRYKELYDVTTNMIQSDDLDWPRVLELGNKLEGQSSPDTKFCQDRNQLVRLYQDAQRVKPTFDSVFSKIAASTNGRFLPGTLKPLFRALEKTVMKRSDDPTLDRAERVCDVVRGMLVYKEFGGMVRGMQAMANHADVHHMRTKCRFAVPTSGGWRDVVSNIRFHSDEEGHICEIQFVHDRMLVVRKQMGGHDEYNYFRSAIELLEVVDGSD
jgi:hypothetical protein